MTIIARFSLILAGTALLAACGGGGGVPAVTRPAAGTTATSSALVQVEVPLHATAASAHARSPQWVSPNTTFFLVDLQNNADARFDNTFAVDAAHCQSTMSSGVPVLACTFTAIIPAGDPTTQRWSIVAGAGKTDGSSGPPLSVVHGIAAQTVNGQAQILGFLDTIVATVAVSELGLGNFQGPLPAKYVPYFTITALDAFGNASPGDETANPGVEQFANPITLTEDDASGLLGFGIISHAGGPSPYQPPNPPLVSTTAFNRLNQTAAIEIVDNVTTSGAMNVSYSLPAVTLQPSEFPQLAAAWSNAAKTVKLASYSCGPLTNSATVNPCTQTFP